MAWFSNFIAKLYGFVAGTYSAFASASFLVFVLVWFIVFSLTKDKKKATARSMDITTIFLIGVVAGLLDQMLQLSFTSIWIILLIFILAFGLIGNAQHRLHGRINVRKQFRVVWRLGFLGLSALYCILLMIGLGTYIFS